jgi:erythromycin esterase
MKKVLFPIKLVMGLVCLCILSSCHQIEENKPEDLNKTWLRQHAVILNSADPVIPENNLNILKEKIGDARIVGLGEANHGTSEFWGIRQKISAYLIDEMGFSAILMEAGFPNSLYADNYITKGEGSATEAHQKLAVWRYQEMLNLIDWMRSYNMAHTQDADYTPIRYFGYDCAFHNWTEAIHIITGYLHLVDPEETAHISSMLENYTVEDARHVCDFLELNKTGYVSKSSEDEFNLILRIARNLEPNWITWYNLRNGLPDYNVRDGFNIDNVNWIIENMLDGGKVVIWAHNGHVGDCLLENEGETARMLGSRLKDQYGEDYYVIAAEFFSGNFYAWDRCENHAYSFVVQSAAIPSSSTYAYCFHSAGIPLFFLDLRYADYTNEGAEWLLGPRRLRFIGASYCPTEDRYFYDTLSLPENYDGIIFFEEISPTTRVFYE